MAWDIMMPWDFRDDRPVMKESDIELIELGRLTLLLTIALACEFTCCQAFEYYDALFYINDGIFGSTFYVATGFHGLHVIIGSVFLIVCLYRVNEQFIFYHHVGYEMAIWYWHFVDVI